MSDCGRSRYKGRFETRRKIKWRENVSVAGKRRKKEDDVPPNIMEGNCIVNLVTLARELWCSNCDKPLSLRYIEGEQLVGLVKILNIKCEKCLKMYSVKTSERIHTCEEDARSHHYSLNIKATTGIIDAGLGVTQLNTLLFALNIPPVHDSLVRRHQIIVEGVRKNLADESCEQAISEEKIATLTINAIETNQDDNEAEAVPLTVSCNGARPKRGNGFTYDSLSGSYSLLSNEEIPVEKLEHKIHVRYTSSL